MNHELDPRLREKLMDYNRPPETPRERMWEAIQARRQRDGRAASRGSARIRSQTLRRMAWPIAAAALLLLGIGLGRMTKDSDPADINPIVESLVEAPRPRTDLYDLAAERYLGRAEILLTRYLGSERNGEDLDHFQIWAAQLMVETRLLLDSPAGADADTRRLLQDLELVLARLTRLEGQGNGDRRILDESLDTGTLMMRLKTRKPAASLPNGA